MHSYLAVKLVFEFLLERLPLAIVLKKEASDQNFVCLKNAAGYDCDCIHVFYYMV